jgi:hypothetical protein
MSTPASATERPPGPHRQNVKLVTQEEEKASKDAEKTFPEQDSNEPKAPTHQRLVLTDPIAFR